MARRYIRIIKKVTFYLLVILLTPIWIMPFYWLVRSLFMGIGGMFRNPPVWIPIRRRLENYRDVLTALPFVRYFLNTVLIAYFSVMGILVDCLLNAYGSSRTRWNHRDAIFAILMPTMILPYSITSMPNFIIWKKLGFINTLISTIVPTWSCMEIASVYDGGVLNIFFLRQFIRTIPRELDEAAFMGRAGHWTVFTQIILPLSKPPLTCVGLSTLLNSRNGLINPLIYLNSDKRYTTQFGPRTFIGYFNVEWHLVIATVCAIAIPVVLVFLVGQKCSAEGIAITGLKG